MAHDQRPHHQARKHPADRQLRSQVSRRPADYFDDNLGRRSITGKMTGADALQAAKMLARAEQDKLDRSDG
jgi:hypothetical protein